MKFVLVDLFSDKRVIMYGVRLFSFALNAEPLGILSSIVLTYDITVFNIKNLFGLFQAFFPLYFCVYK